jgi:poly(A) polymerase
MKFKDVLSMRPATLKKFVRLERFEYEHLELHRLDCLSSHRHLENYYFMQNFLKETPPAEVRPERILSGEDLKQQGLAPGPLFRRILEAVEEAQLDGRLHNREEALAFIRSNFANDLHTHGS